MCLTSDDSSIVLGDTGGGVLLQKCSCIDQWLPTRGMANPCKLGPQRGHWRILQLCLCVLSTDLYHHWVGALWMAARYRTFASCQQSRIITGVEPCGWPPDIGSLHPVNGVVSSPGWSLVDGRQIWDQESLLCVPFRPNCVVFLSAIGHTPWGGCNQIRIFRGRSIGQSPQQIKPI
jgi:hypothetical protein